MRLWAAGEFFTDEEFEKWIKPFDLQIMKAIKDKEDTVSFTSARTS